MRPFRAPRARATWSRATARTLPLALALLWSTGTTVAADLQAPAAIREAAQTDPVIPRLSAEVIARWPSASALRAAGYERGRPGEIVRVMLSIRVSKAGTIDRLAVYESNDPGDLYVQAALEAARSARYQPAREGAPPRAAWTLLCIDFPAI